MAINKVVYGNTTLVDLTGTTATSDKILTGYGAYGKDGVWMNGSAVDTSDANATASDIVNSKTAYVNGSKVTGSLIIQTYYTGSSDPSSSLGSNGDIYLKVSS